jgi:hypothetical protein
LKLDADTRRIPVLTYATEHDADEDQEDVTERTDAEMFAPKPAVWMN